MLHKRLKTIRTTLGLSQEEVAKACGITQSAYCRIENGDRMPSLSVIMRLAKIFDASIDYLVFAGERLPVGGIDEDMGTYVQIDIPAAIGKNISKHS